MDHRVWIPVGRRSRWLALGIWVALAGVAVPIGSRLANVTNDDYVLPASAQTARLQRTLAERFPGGDQRLAFAVYRRPGGLTGADRARMFADAARLSKVENVARVIPAFAPGAPKGLVSPRGDAALTVIPIHAGKIFRVRETMASLREIAQSRGGLDVHVTGFPALISDINSIVKEADVKLLGATVALILLLLVLVYRSPVLALLPLTVVGVAYVVARAVIYLLNRSFGVPIDSTSNSLLLVLIFGAGTDYCLLYVARYRAALSREDRTEDALREAGGEAAPAVLASGATVIAALLAMLGAIFGVLRTIGPVNAIGIAIVLTASLTLLPAVLALLGPWAFWPLAHRAAREEGTESGRWFRVGRAIRARPLAWLSAAVLALGGGALGLLAYHPDVNPLQQFRKATDGTRGFDTLRTAFPPGAVNPTTLLVDRANAPLTRTDFASVVERVRAVPGVAAVTPTGSRSRDGRATTATVVFTDDPFRPPALARLARLRHDLASPVPGVKTLFGDGTGERYDYKQALVRDAKVIVPIILLVVFLVLVVLLRALVAPIYLLATILLSFLASLGASVLVFRYAIGRPIDPIVPVIVFMFLVALGSDYNIFLMSRVREEARRHETREAMLRGLGATGPVITSAGVILAGTFGVLMVLPFYVLFEIGFAIALGVLVDTFVVRTVCVPALMWLFGERSWWPVRVFAPD